jgi:hypothetical protein
MRMAPDHTYFLAHSASPCSPPIASRWRYLTRNVIFTCPVGLSQLAILKGGGWLGSRPWWKNRQSRALDLRVCIADRPQSQPRWATNHKGCETMTSWLATSTGLRSVAVAGSPYPPSRSLPGRMRGNMLKFPSIHHPYARSIWLGSRSRISSRESGLDAAGVMGVMDPKGEFTCTRSGLKASFACRSHAIPSSPNGPKCVAVWYVSASRFIGPRTDASVIQGIHIRLAPAATVDLSASWSDSMARPLAENRHRPRGPRHSRMRVECEPVREWRRACGQPLAEHSLVATASNQPGPRPAETSDLPGPRLFRRSNRFKSVLASSSLVGLPHSGICYFTGRTLLEWT